MIVLGVDTGGAACSAAIWRDGATVAAEIREMARGHAERLVPMILDLCARAEIRPRDIDLYGVTVGPGAFTGLRIGLATVAGMALASGRPIVGVGSFDAFAAMTTAEERVGRTLLVAIDSRRTEMFVRTFREDLTPLSDPAWASPGELAGRLPPGPLLVAGDAAPAALTGLAARDAVAARGTGQIDPALVAALAARDEAKAGLLPPEPFYLRPPDAIPAAERAAAASGRLPDRT